MPLPPPLMMPQLVPSFSLGTGLAAAALPGQQGPVGCGLGTVRATGNMLRSAPNAAIPPLAALPNLACQTLTRAGTCGPTPLAS